MATTTTKTALASIENSIRLAGETAVINAAKNMFAEVKRQVANAMTPEYLADLYPHETLSEAEKAEIIESATFDCMNRGLKFLDLRVALMVEKACK